MANKISTCPHCNNYVEGKRKSSSKKTVARTTVKALVKEGSKDAVEMGTIGAGAAIGTLICPGVGTVIGGAAGWIGKALANNAIGKKVDQAADYFEDEYTEVVYHYSCPKCGYSWNSTSSNASYSNSSSRSAILHLLSECSNIKSLNEGCSLSFAGISYSKLKQALHSTYNVNLFEYELNSCKNVRQLIELIENRIS